MYIFYVIDDDVSHITRAVQEDEILKTRLKLTQRGEVVDLPSVRWCLHLTLCSGTSCHVYLPVSSNGKLKLPFSNYVEYLLVSGMYM